MFFFKTQDSQRTLPSHSGAVTVAAAADAGAHAATSRLPSKKVARNQSLNEAASSATTATSLNITEGAPTTTAGSVVVTAAIPTRAKVRKTLNMTPLLEGNTSQNSLSKNHTIKAKRANQSVMNSDVEPTTRNTSREVSNNWFLVFSIYFI